MFRVALRAQRVWSALPVAVRLAAIVAAVVVLLSLSVAPALAGSEPNPFRWYQ